MKKIIALGFVLWLFMFSVSCTRDVSTVGYLEGEITEISEIGVTVKITDSGTSGIAVGSLAFFGIKDSTHIGMADKVSLTYSGEVTETEPIHFSGPYQLEVIEKAPHIEEKSPEPEKELLKGTVTEIGRGKLNPDIELSRADAEVIFNILDGGVWEKVDTECTRDCKVVINGVLYYYHSECGAFFRPNLAEYTTSSFKKTENSGESLELSDELKTEVNGILEKYITLGFPDSYPEPDFYPDKFEVLISDFESVRVAKKESEEAIINLIQRQRYTEPICDCLPDILIRHDGKYYGVKLSANEAFIRLDDSQAPLSPEDISELREILKDNQVLVSNP